MEHGKLKVVKEKFRLNLCLKEAMDLFLHEADRKGIKLSLAFANRRVPRHRVRDVTADREKEPEKEKEREREYYHTNDSRCGVPEIMYTDPARLRQILLNLLSNAVKFTPAGGTVSVEVSCERVDIVGDADKELVPSPDGRFDHLYFIVKDTGGGISSEVAKKLFQPFTQGDASFSRKTGGTGLGLAICKQLVELLNGKIWAENNTEQGKGKGAEFHFTLLCDHVEQQDAMLSDAPGGGASNAAHKELHQVPLHAPPPLLSKPPQQSSPPQPAPPQQLQPAHRPHQPQQPQPPQPQFFGSAVLAPNIPPQQHQGGLPMTTVSSSSSPGCGITITTTTTTADGTTIVTTTTYNGTEPATTMTTTITPRGVYVHALPGTIAPTPITTTSVGAAPPMQPPQKLQLTLPAAPPVGPQFSSPASSPRTIIYPPNTPAPASTSSPPQSPTSTRAQPSLLRARSQNSLGNLLPLPGTRTYGGGSIGGQFMPRNPSPLQRGNSGGNLHSNTNGIISTSSNNNSNTPNNCNNTTSDNANSSGNNSHSCNGIAAANHCGTNPISCNGNISTSNSSVPQAPLQILVAEDNIANQKLLLQLLKRLQYAADLANDGCEALEKWRAKKYDVILMDLQMPNMDGLEATRHIMEESAEGERPQVIAVTANVYDSDKENCAAVGMCNFIGKPIKLPLLKEALQLCENSKRNSARVG